MSEAASPSFQFGRETAKHSRREQAGEDCRLDSTMSGYPIDGIIFKNQDDFNHYLCSKCDLLLKEPVQPSCGHRLCKSCADEIIAKHASPPCPQADCEEPFDNEDGEYVSKLIFAPS
jgi:hypothetical protein